MASGNISTRSGDQGKTGIRGGVRVDKDDARIECLGEIDETNSMIGLLRSKLSAEHPWELGLKRHSGRDNEPHGPCGHTLQLRTQTCCSTAY